MKSILFVLGLCFLLISCKKEEKAEFDYRDEFIGEYSLEYHYTLTVFVNPPVVEVDTTINYIGQIKALETNRLSVDTPNGGVLNLEVDESGSLLLCGNYVGNIVNNTINLQYTDDTCTGGPLGSNYVVQLSGTK